MSIEIRGNKDSDTVVFFLHGGTGMDCSYFIPYFDDLDVKQVYYKQGEVLGKTSSMSDLVLELREVYSLEKGQDNVLLGHSLGGALALEYLRRYEYEDCLSLILISAVFSHKWTDFYTGLNPNANLFDESISDFTSSDSFYQSECLFYLPQYFSTEFQEIGREVLSKIKYDYELRKIIYDSYMRKFDCTDVLKELNLPSLSLSFEGDRIVSNNYSLMIKDINPQVNCKSFKGLSHFPFVEDKDLIINEISNFLKEKL